MPLQLSPEDVRYLIVRRAGVIKHNAGLGVPAEKLEMQVRELLKIVIELGEIEELYKQKLKEREILGPEQYAKMYGEKRPDVELAKQSETQTVEELQSELEKKRQEILALKEAMKSNSKKREKKVKADKGEEESETDRDITAHDIPVDEEGEQVVEW